MRFRFFLVLVFGLLFLWPENTFALSISPLRQEFILDPGSNQTVILQIKNNEAKDLNINFKILGVSQDESGRPVFDTKTNIVDDWIQTPQSILLKVGEEKTVEFKMTLPKDIYPTLYSFALVASASKEGQEIGLNTDLVSLLSVQVAGLAQEKLAINNWSAQSRISYNKNWQFNLDLKNLSNVRLAMAGDLILSNLKSQVVFQENLLLGNSLLPGTNRILEPIADMETLPLPMGIYSAEVKIVYGETRQLVVDKIYLVYLPQWVVYIVVGLLILFSVFIGFVIYRRKNKKR
ncbi:MAG TPA: hypothetical protein DEB09_02050 [Candidatus Magasanikbacteria bacterium]|nr:hypothetical protein [Candidatus Magasanikbacteria bacterium]